METYEQYEKRMVKNAKRFRKSLGINDTLGLDTKSVKSAKSSNGYSSGSNVVIRIIILLFMAVFIINVIRVANNSNLVTFSGFLQWLSNYSNTGLNISVNISDYVITADWLAFNWLRDFFNVFAGAFGVISYMAVSLVNMFSFVSYIIVFLLV